MKCTLSRTCAALFLFLVVTSSVPVLADTQCSPGLFVIGTGYVLGIGSNINLNLQGMSSSDASTAVDNWRSGCPGTYGSSFPSVSIGGQGGIGINVIFHPQGNAPYGSGCGYTDLSVGPVSGSNPGGRYSGQVVGGTIHIYTHTSAGVGCDPNWDTLTHEIGHLFGLGDASSNCSIFGSIMSPRQLLTNSSGSQWLSVRAVQGSDCDTADEENETAVESGVGPCKVSTTLGSVIDPCGTDGGVGGRIPYPPASPIVVDLDRGGFRFTSAADGVQFDITADGAPDQTAWIAPGSGDGFLVLDRNGNGVIDGARELFGTFTPQPPSPQPNGFSALALFDAPGAGGDGDGVITREDSVFADLRLWVDADHDGFSSQDELHTLSEYGVAALHLDPVVAARHDQYGNLLRLKAHADLDEGGVVQMIDVYLMVLDSASQ